MRSEESDGGPQLEPSTPGNSHRITFPPNHTTLAAIVLAGLTVGSLLWLAGQRSTADWVWGACVFVVLIPLTASIIKALAHGRIGVDVIALAAMAGSLLLGEQFAGVVIALMLSGGEALEEFAEGRAKRSLTSLVERTPREAHLRTENEIREVSADEVKVGDVLVVRAGEMAAVDGVLLSAHATLDQSTLTGEPLPVEFTAGAAILSGSVNAGETIEVRAERTHADSTYSAIVRLVEQALARKSPMVRMADRYAVWFLALTAATATLAWALSGDAIRALAVLVVATPCPLILAPPVALVAGTSRAASLGVIIKGAAAIEKLGQARVVLMDKTGTLTTGRPSVTGVVSVNPSMNSANEVLLLAGALEQMSVHSLAEALAHSANEIAQSEGRPLPVPTDVRETSGSGIRGVVTGTPVAVGSRRFLESIGVDTSAMDVSNGAQSPVAATVREAADRGDAFACVAFDGDLAGIVFLGDEPRPDALGIGSALAANGIDRVLMLTGDHAAAAKSVAKHAGVSEVRADCSPSDKLAILDEQRAMLNGRGTVVMVGDGVNDAPALAAADVGIAMGSAGATAASESAEALIIPEQISLVVDAIRIGQRSRGIALQSIGAGMALSMCGMVAAAFGYLPPVAGALTQEAIDLAVIINAMRALKGR